MTIFQIYSAPEYSGFQSSPEILAAIEELAGDELMTDDDGEALANKLWSDGYLGSYVNGKWVETVSSAQVVARAWEMAHPDEDKLIWGASSFERAPD